MLEILNWLNIIETFYWQYIGVSLIILSGIYFTIKTKGFQFKVIYNFKDTFRTIRRESKNKHLPGIHPIKLYFASIGGMVGLGNIVVIVTSVVYGGPGVLVWLWIAAFAGMIIKYCEIYLGIKFRHANGKNSFNGGPMYYLREAFGAKFIPIILCVMLCIYGVEVSQFKIITDTVCSTFNLDNTIITYCFIALVIYSSIGGIKRLANTCTLLMPPFIIFYLFICLWVIIAHYEILPSIFMTIIKSAFVGHAPIFGFAGSTYLMAAQTGVARAVYSSDIGIGYDSIIQSETATTFPEIQAKMAIFAQLTDAFICTLSILVVLVTGIWHNPFLNEPSEYIIEAFAMHFPYVKYFMAGLFFLAGFTTIIAYFTVGIKCAEFINGKWGRKIYILYAILALITTNYLNQTTLITIMSLAGGILVFLNLFGIMKLKKYIKFPI
jgi:AGCS family alanine or glycine:cation symporter